MKRLFTMLLSITMLCCFAGCDSNWLNNDVDDENFCCEVIDENNIAIGDLKTYPESGAVFFPEKIKNYTVSKLGFSSGLGFGGNGYLGWVSEQNGNDIKRCYFPHTIKEIYSGYMYLVSGSLKLFYCGEIIDLGRFHPRDGDGDIYVPVEKYSLFEEVLSEYFNGSLLKANISYYLNYAENNYYYIDYYENGEKILYIPPEPQRDGYLFGGWFKEADCINQWNFDFDILQIEDEEQEVKLYAKWIAE